MYNNDSKLYSHEKEDMKNHKYKLFTSKTNNLRQTPQIKQQSLKQIALFYDRNILSVLSLSWNH